MTVVDLAGAWQVREALGDTWRWHAGSDHLPEREADSWTVGWLPATVPGSVLADLIAASEVPDPFRDRDSRQSEWVAERHWVYRRRIDVPDGPVVLELDGVDPAATVLLDGVAVAEVSGMFRHHRVPLLAEPGGHWLAVVVHPAPVSEPQVGETSRVRLLSPRMTYGWDFCPRLPHQGIWQAIRLVCGERRFETLQVRSAWDGSAGRLVVTGTARGTGSLTVTCQGVETVAEVAAAAGTVETGARAFHAELPVPGVEPWWPSGHGEQPLYDVTVRLDGEVQRIVRTGFRDLAWVANVGSASLDPEPLPLTCVVNGRRIGVKGYNWVPADLSYGRTDPEHVTALLRTARHGGANLLRVWGGGLLETEHFYDTCDRLGLMVWQEFAQSSSGISSAPADDAAFVAYAAEEARAIVPLRTHHPSLVLWCGGNELSGPEHPLTDRDSPVLAAIHEVVAEVHPEAGWLPTSPSGPKGAYDLHGPWEHQGLTRQHQYYDNGRWLAQTEFGVEGMTHLSTLAATVSESLWEPLDERNPVMRHRGEWWDNAPLVRSLFALPDTAPVGVVQRCSQWLQATGLGYAVEASRRRLPVMSMVIPWQLNEPYPNVWCTSSVDHYGRAKPAYHAVAAAYRPDRVSLKVATSAWAGSDPTVEAWVWSEHGHSGGQVAVEALAMDGTVLARSEADTGLVGYGRPVGWLTMPAADVGREPFLWRAVWSDRGGRVDEAFLVATGGDDLSGLLRLGPATVEIVPGPGAFDVRHRSGPAVVGLRVLDEGEVMRRQRPLVRVPADVLLPGEELRIDVEGPGPLVVDAFNLAPVVVEEDRWSR